MKETRKETYIRRKNTLIKKCKTCISRDSEQCDECIIGLRLRWLETEFSDITLWNHQNWDKNSKNGKEGKK